MYSAREGPLQRILTGEQNGFELSDASESSVGAMTALGQLLPDRNPAMIGWNAPLPVVRQLTPNIAAVPPESRRFRTRARRLTLVPRAAGLGPAAVSFFASFRAVAAA